MTLTTLIAKLEEDLKAASPGPWEFEVAQYGAAISDRGLCIATTHNRSPGTMKLEAQDLPFEANARLIALMRKSLPTLIEALSAAEARAEAAEARVGELGKLCKEAADLYGQGGTFPIDGVMSERLRTAARTHAKALLNPDPWRPIEELPEEWKDGRKLDLWVRDYADGGFRVPDCKLGTPWPGTAPCWLELKPRPDARHDWEWQPIDFVPTHFRELKGPGQ